ncbi:MAG: protein kinase [Polyangiaceae bacterium]
MLVEEACLASRIHHPNVVAVLDVEQMDDHLLLVMDYIEGASLADILAVKGEAVASAPAVRIALDACAGCSAAHELTDAAGKPLQIVHRDVSPQNLLVGIDGVSRLTDFGIAKSTQHASTTTTGALKGKLAYMAPEYVDGEPPDQRSDVFGLGVVIWEALANRRLFRGETEVDTLKRIVNAEAPLFSTVAPAVGVELDPVLAAALAKDPEQRFPSAKALGTALEIAAKRADMIASAEEVGAFVQGLFESPLSERRRLIQERVAADVGPASARPTVPMPQRREGLAATVIDAPPAGDARFGAAPRGAATPAIEAAPRDADSSTGPVRTSIATTPIATMAPGHRDAMPSASTLDGSGLSQLGREPASSVLPTRPSRTLRILGAIGALLVGALAAIGVGRWTGSSGTEIAPANTSEAALPSGTTPSITAHSRRSVQRSARSDGPPTPSATPLATSSAKPPATTSAKRPATKPTATSTAAADVLPNPYGPQKISAFEIVERCAPKASLAFVRLQRTRNAPLPPRIK